EAHTSLAQIALFYEYDFTGAEKSFKRAIELDPNYATARQWYGILLTSIGKNDESVREAKKALELDPFSLRINSDLYSSLANANRFDEALLQNKKLNELFPNEGRFHLGNFQIYADQGKYDQAVEEFLLSVEADKDFKAENITRMKEAYGKRGWDGFWLILGEIRLEELNARQAKDPNGYIRAGEFANAYAWGKNKDKTIEYLNKAYDERERGMVNLKANKDYDFVRDDPRFKELVKRVGIPE
ncbi:MAG: hypothetical protein KBF83_14225, partial [Pyrinomonadaceae bacterium]|nr:hypothetical protein [Pyrinomonadaceae bacterium]